MSERPICVTFRGLSGEKLGDVSIESTLSGRDLVAIWFPPDYDLTTI